MTTQNIIGLLVLIVLVASSAIAAILLGVPARSIDIAFGLAWLASSIYAYHFVCVRNRDRFVLYTKLTSRGGKGPGLFEKGLIFVFGPYWLWSHGAWPKILHRLGRS